MNHKLYIIPTWYTENIFTDSLFHCTTTETMVNCIHYLQCLSSFMNPFFCCDSSRKYVSSSLRPTNKQLNRIHNIKCHYGLCLYMAFYMFHTSSYRNNTLLRLCKDSLSFGKYYYKSNQNFRILWTIPV